MLKSKKSCLQSFKHKGTQPEKLLPARVVKKNWPFILARFKWATLPHLVGRSPYYGTEEGGMEHQYIALPQTRPA